MVGYMGMPGWPLVDGRFADLEAHLLNYLVPDRGFDCGVVNV